MLYRATITNREVALDKAGFHQNTVGKDTLRLMLDEEWDGAEFVIVSFYRGRVSRATAEICGQRLWAGEDVDVPAAALTEAGDLRITVTGVWPDGSQIVTCEMEEGAEVCWSGADSVDYEVDPGKDAISLLTDMVQTANAAAVAAKEAAQSAEAIAEVGYLPAEGAVGQWLRKTAGDSEWADLPVPTAAEVGADPAGSAEAAKAEAMEAVGALSARVDLIANSDDETLDQLAEFAEFVKENRNLIENLDPLPQGGSDGQVLTLVEGEAAWADASGGADTWHAATVSLTDDGLAFVGDVPSPHNDGGDALTLAVDVSGAWAEAAEAGALSMRFGDGSEASVVDGSCYVPRDAMAVAGGELSVQAVAYSGQVAVEGEVFHTGSVKYISNEAVVGIEFGPAAHLVEGEEYILTIGDIERRGTAAVIVEGGETTYCVGNPSLYGMETDNGLDYLVTTFEMMGTIVGGVLLNLDRSDLDGATVTVSTAGTQGETVSNALTVPLLPGEPGMFTVVERVEGEVLVETDTTSEGAFNAQPDVLAVVIGEKYAVSFDGTEYVCDCMSYMGAPYIGNFGRFAEMNGAPDPIPPDTGEPFVMFSDSGMTMFTAFDQSKHHVVISTAPTATAKRLADAFGEIVERTTVEVAGEVVLAEATYAKSSNNIVPLALLEEGETYVASFSGETLDGEVIEKTEYTCVASRMTLEGVEGTCIGEPGYFTGELSGDPDVPTDFCFFTAENPNNPSSLVGIYITHTVNSIFSVYASTSAPVTEAVTSLATRVDALEGAGGVTMEQLEECTTVKVEGETVIPEQTFTSTSQYDDIWTTGVPSLAFELTDGELYEVSYNGVVYTCAGVVATQGSATGYSLGNIGIVGGGEDTGEPFVVAYLSGQGTLVYSKDESPTISVKKADNSTPVTEAVLDLDARVDKLDGSGVAAAMFVFDMFANKYKLVGITPEALFEAYLAYQAPLVVVHGFHENNQYWKVCTNAIGYDESGNNSGVNGGGPVHYINFHYSTDEYVALRIDGATRSWDNTEWQIA